MLVCELAVVGHLEPDYKRLSEEKLGLRTAFGVIWGLPFRAVSCQQNYFMLGSLVGLLPQCLHAKFELGWLRHCKDTFE